MGISLQRREFNRGKCVENATHTVGEDKYFIPDGFKSKWAIKCEESSMKFLSCTVNMYEGFPLYQCSHDGGTFNF